MTNVEIARDINVTNLMWQMENHGDPPPNTSQPTPTPPRMIVFPRLVADRARVFSHPQKFGTRRQRRGSSSIQASQPTSGPATATTAGVIAAPANASAAPATATTTRVIAATASTLVPTTSTMPQAPQHHASSST